MSNILALWSVIVKLFVKISLVVLLLIVCFIITYQLAAERVEVVELHTTDDSGASVTTRLWIVDHEGFPYLRSSSESSGWYTRIHANAQFDLTREEEVKSYTALDRRDKAGVVNGLMREKYTWGDRFVEFFMGSRDGSIPLELHEI